MTTLQELKDASGDPRLRAFIGKNVFVGIYQFYKGDPVERSQDFGQIAGIEDGVMVIDDGGRRKFFPPAFEAFVPAPRGRYTLDSNRVEMLNPDYLVSWRLDLADNLPDSQWTANTAPHFDSIVGREWFFDYAYDEEYVRRMALELGPGLVGKTLLAGISEVEGGGQVKRSQVVGEIARVSFSEGVVLRLKDGAELALPPDVTLLQVPQPGEYELDSNGEVVVDPDLMTIWDKTSQKNG